MSDTPANPPPRRGRHRIPLSGLSGPRYSPNPKVLVLWLLGAGVAAGIIFGLSSMSAETRMAQRGHFDDEVVIGPGKEFGYIIIVTLSSSQRLYG